MQPREPHQHWHTDISYLNICGTFYYLCSVLDGCSRANLQWEIRESMTEPEVELVLQKAKEKYPTATPRLISDNGPQFIARDFKQFVRLSGMDHVRTSPSIRNRMASRAGWHGSLKSGGRAAEAPLSLGGRPAGGRRLRGGGVQHQASSQCDRGVRHAAGSARWPAHADLGRSETANSKRPAHDAPPGANRRELQPAWFIPGIAGTPVHAEPGQAVGRDESGPGALEGENGIAARVGYYIQAPEVKWLGLVLVGPYFLRHTAR